MTTKGSNRYGGDSLSQGDKLCALRMAEPEKHNEPSFWKPKRLCVSPRCWTELFTTLEFCFALFSSQTARTWLQGTLYSRRLAADVVCGALFSTCYKMFWFLLCCLQSLTLLRAPTWTSILKPSLVISLSPTIPAAMPQAPS